MNKCLAKNRSGGECQKSAMPNGRCHLHGGKSTGAPEGNTNAVSHGFYAKCYTEEEKNDLGSIEIGTLAAELRLAKTQLRRAASADEFQKDGKTPNENYRPDVIERLLNTVGRLEKQHAEINTDGDNEFDWATLAKVGAFLTEEVDSIKISRRTTPPDNGKKKV